MDDVKGIIFNIQRYSIHDGPGIRTTVFMKGCPLGCMWCQNPESKELRSEIFYNRERCVGCGKCLPTCPEKAIQLYEGRSKTNRELCEGCGTCVDVCPHEARSLIGRNVSAAEVFNEVNKDVIFYQRSGGGVTLSGGEPTVQPDFAISLLKLCKNAGIHTAIDTCGHVPWETMERILSHIDLVLYDFKHMNPAEHKRGTGASNNLILDNVKKIHHQCAIPLIARVAIIPGYNDSTGNIESIARFISNELTPSINVHLLPYHRLGESKYDQLEKTRRTPGIEPLGEEEILRFKEVIESFGMTTIIGG
jgi:pyruvate formate lyase activating enzyme